MHTPGPDSLKFGGAAKIPPAPETVPEKYKKVWNTLPPCCRNFYINPGKGCCAGLPEPNAASMSTHQTIELPKGAVEADRQGDVCEIPLNRVKKPTWKQPLALIKYWASETVDWFKHLFMGFFKDMKRLLTGRQTD